MTNKQAEKPLTYTVPTAGRMAGLSRNGSYLAAERGEIPTMNFGRLLRVPAAAWDQILREGRPVPPTPQAPLNRSRRAG